MSWDETGFVTTAQADCILFNFRMSNILHFFISINLCLQCIGDAKLNFFKTAINLKQEFIKLQSGPHFCLAWQPCKSWCPSCLIIGVLCHPVECNAIQWQWLEKCEADETLRGHIGILFSAMLGMRWWRMQRDTVLRMRRGHTEAMGQPWPEVTRSTICSLELTERMLHSALFAFCLSFLTDGVLFHSLVLCMLSLTVLSLREGCGSGGGAVLQWLNQVVWPPAVDTARCFCASSMCVNESILNSSESLCSGTWSSKGKFHFIFWGK